MCLLVCVASLELRAEPIEELVLPDAGDLSPGRMRELLGLSEGAQFSEAEADKGLKRLANTGRFQALALNYDEKIGRLVLELRLFDVLERVEVSFSKNNLSEELLTLLRADIREVSGLSRGDQISLDQMNEIRERILRRLRLRGFPDALLVLALEEGEDESQKRLLVSVDSKDQQMVSSLEFQGFRASDLTSLRELLERSEYTLPYLAKLDVPAEILDRPEEYLISQVKKLRDADDGRPVKYNIEFPYDQVLVSQALGDWGQRMRKAGFFDFKIETKLIESNSKKHLQVSLDRGLRYNVQFRGNVNFWERYLREKVLDRPMRLSLPFSETDAHTVIRNMYLVQGFRDIEIDLQRESLGSERRLTFYIKEGPRYFLGNIMWDGVSSSEKDILNEIVQRWREEFSSPFHHVYYDERSVKAQLPRLLEMVRSEGYLQARFLGSRSLAKRRGNRIPVEIPIQLGPRFRLRDIVVEGRHPLDEDTLDEIVDMQPGDLASSDGITRIATRLKGAIQQRSHLFVSVPERLDEIVSFSDTSDEVDLRYTIEGGPRIKVGQIVVDGLRKTKEEVVLREFRREDMETGEPWKPESLDAIDQRLQAYGLFGNLRMQMVNGRMLERAEESADGIEVQERDLKITLNERPGGAIEFGPGYRTDLGVVAFGEYNYRNLDGMNRSVVVRAQISRKLENYQFPEQRFSFSYLEPYLLDIPLSFRFSTAYEKRDQYIYDKFNQAQDGSFKLDEISTSFTVGKEFSRHIALRHNLYSLSKPRIFDLLGQGGKDSQKYRIATMGPTLTFDFRDNIFNPSSGVLLSSAIEYASPDLGSSDTVNYLLSKSDLSVYFPLRKDFMLATSLSYAYMRTLEDAQTLPVDRRLTLGGRNTIRSLEEKKLNFFDQTQVQVMGSYLYRMEIRQNLFEGIGLAYFFDSGRVDAQGLDGEGWREAVGVSLRYMTPVGPLALDFAFNGDQKQGEDFSRILFSVGVF